MELTVRAALNALSATLLLSAQLSYAHDAKGPTFFDAPYTLSLAPEDRIIPCDLGYVNFTAYKCVYIADCIHGFKEQNCSEKYSKELISKGWVAADSNVRNSSVYAFYKPKDGGEELSHLDPTIAMRTTNQIRLFYKSGLSLDELNSGTIMVFETHNSLKNGR